MSYQEELLSKNATSSEQSMKNVSAGGGCLPKCDVSPTASSTPDHSPPNIVEEDSLGETDVEDDTNDDDNDEGSSIFAVEDFDDAMTIDPVPLADYKSDVRLVSSSTVDFDLCTGTTILCSPQTIKNVWTPLSSPVISKNTHRMLFDSPTISPKRMRSTFDVLPPLPLDQFDSSISLVWDSSCLLIGNDEAGIAKEVNEKKDLCHASYVSRETSSSSSSVDESVIHDPAVENQCQLLPTLDEETDALKDDKTQAEIQQLMRATLKSLIASMRKSKESRAQVLEHLEESPELYSSITTKDTNKVDDDEPKNSCCFKASEQSGNECMDVAFSILVDTDDDNNDDDAQLQQ